MDPADELAVDSSYVKLDKAEPSTIHCRPEQQSSHKSLKTHSKLTAVFKTDEKCEARTCVVLEMEQSYILTSMPWRGSWP